MGMTAPSLKFQCNFSHFAMRQRQHLLKEINMLWRNCNIYVEDAFCRSIAPICGSILPKCWTTESMGKWKFLPWWPLEKLGKKKLPQSPGCFSSPLLQLLTTFVRPASVRPASVPPGNKINNSTVFYSVLVVEPLMRGLRNMFTLTKRKSVLVGDTKLPMKVSREPIASRQM